MGVTIVEVILGAVLAIAITIWVENLRRPRLALGLAAPKDMEYDERPAQHARFLYLDLANEEPPRWARWVSRNAAMQCHGWITFHHLDGQNIFGRSMRIRWSGSPEPVPMSGVVDGKQIQLVDPVRLTITSPIDVYPGDAERLDVAARFDDEDECYGWSNESYFSDPPWRNPDWRLPSGLYLVNVTVTSAGKKCTGIFRLINDVSQQDFRLEPASAGDSARH